MLTSILFEPSLVLLEWPVIRGCNVPRVQFRLHLRAVLFLVSSSGRPCRCGLYPGWFSSVGETAAALFVGVSKSFSLPNG